MRSPLDVVIASHLETPLTLGGFLKVLQLQGRLDGLIHEALAAQLIQDQARQAGLTVAPEEVQAAANDFRRRHGLLAAADVRAWLTARRMSLDDFEAMLKQDALAAEFRQQVMGDRVESYFAAHPAEFEWLRLALVVLGREDQARELATQVREEDRALEEVAREQGLELVRSESFRRELQDPLATPLAAARAGQLLGPVATRRGYVLILVEECRPAALDPATRQRLQDELFEDWLADRLRDAKIEWDLPGLMG